LDKDWIAFQLRMRDFDGDMAARPRIGSAEDGGHATAGRKALDLIFV
jgi:hypothetical protein